MVVVQDSEDFVKTASIVTIHDFFMTARTPFTIQTITIILSIASISTNQPRRDICTDEEEYLKSV